MEELGTHSTYRKSGAGNSPPTVLCAQLLSRSPLTSVKFNSQVLAQSTSAAVRSALSTLVADPSSYAPNRECTIGGRDNKSLKPTRCSLSFIRQLECWFI